MSCREMELVSRKTHSGIVMIILIIFIVIIKLIIIIILSAATSTSIQGVCSTLRLLLPNGNYYNTETIDGHWANVRVSMINEFQSNHY